MTTLVFVYGTLKHDLFNYDVFLKPALAQGKATFVGAARTEHASFQMVLDDQEFYPCLFLVESDGYQVPGEVFSVDTDTLAALDQLEEVDDDLYQRKEVSVEMLDGERQGETLSCHIYLAPVTQELLAMERIRDYTAEMNAKYAALLDSPDVHSHAHRQHGDSKTG